MKSARSGKYDGCGRVVHPNEVIASLVLMLEWGRSLSCCHRVVTLRAGPPRTACAYNFGRTSFATSTTTAARACPKVPPLWALYLRMACSSKYFGKNLRACRVVPFVVYTLMASVTLLPPVARFTTFHTKIYVPSASISSVPKPMTPKTAHRCGPRTV
ncbi:hypothetical protein ElyMa_006052600 [Elysia marginata]|uniref:Isopenicillin N synthase-like Fe(2+) 2OG dioxygenase domain-containing protein n=1 Tax=Elysia marginata TaxID=1093978 RepID=A0AAV4GLX2_9GAST|nr:hypothetical protein ElyMa_006052600 [Elysia marginata]